MAKVMIVFEDKGDDSFDIYAEGDKPTDMASMTPAQEAAGSALALILTVLREQGDGELTLVPPGELKAA